LKSGSWKRYVGKSTTKIKQIVVPSPDINISLLEIMLKNTSKILMQNE